MRIGKQAIFFAAVLVGALMAVSACGAQTEPGPGGIAGTPGSTGTPGTAPVHPDLPDRVRILSDELGLLPPGVVLTTPEATQPAVTLTDVAQVRQLYATISALPVLPQDRACTAERGPHYTLTFLQGEATVSTVQFHRDGCWPVFIAGDSKTREGSKEFVQQLDRAIRARTHTDKTLRLRVSARRTNVRSSGCS